MSARRNLASLLDDLAADPARRAFTLRTPYRAFHWTAGRTRSVASGVSMRLGSLGVQPGDRVLLQGHSSPEWCAAFLGIVARGAVVVPLDVGWSPELVRGVARKVDARAAVIGMGRAESLGAAGPPIIHLEQLASWHGSLEEIPEPHRADSEDTAEIVFTSGTTSAPRGVELSHANLLAGVERIERGFRKREWYLRPLLPMRLMCTVPLSHLFGQSLGVLIPVVMKSTAVFPSSLQPGRLLRAIRAEGPLALIAVPRTLATLRDAVLRRLDRDGRRERFEGGRARTASARVWSRIWATRELRRILGWRTWALVVGGAALDPDVEDFWSGCGFAVIEGYGMTEAAPIIAVRNPLDGPRRTLGRAVGGVEVRLADDGELWVRGPNVMKGYHGDPDATDLVLRDGWLRTGDIAERDEDGRLYFRGRKKDVIVTANGMNVFPSDVEGVVREVVAVRDVVVFGVAGPEGDEVSAAVVPAGRELDPQRARTRANERLEPHQRLRRIVVWDGADFPRTATGKVRRGEVAEAIARGHRRTTAGESSASRVVQAFERIRADGLEPGHLDSLDSLETIELIGLIEEEYGVTVDDREVQGPITVAQIERLVGGGDPPAVRIVMPRWGRRALARWIRRVLQLVLVPPLFGMFVRLSVEGREHLDGLHGATLLAANHTSVFDVPAILMALPGRFRRRLCPAMATETVPSMLYALAVLTFNAYPLPQGRAFRPSLEYTGELLDHALLPLVFPEGRMSPTGRMGPFKSGIGLLAIETRARIVPVRVEGLRAILPPGSRWPRRGTARVVFGKPIDAAPGTDRSAQSVSQTIEAAVRALGIGG